MSVPHGRGGRAVRAMEVLSRLKEQGTLEEGIRICMEAIQKESRCEVVWPTGPLALFLDTASLTRSGGPVAAMNAHSGPQVPGNGENGLGPTTRSGQRQSGGAVRHISLTFDGRELGGLAFRFSDSQDSQRCDRRLGAWLGLLGALVQASLARSEMVEAGCLDEWSFLRQLYQQCEWCRKREMPLSVWVLRFQESGGTLDPQVPELKREWLCQQGGRLRNQLRASDRVGLAGGALYCLLPETDSVASRVALLRIRKEWASQSPAGSSRLPPGHWVAATVTTPEDGLTPARLLETLAFRLYQSLARDEPDRISKL